ncbi:hypothetical protein D5086_022916 [Populus alba]|uniref:Uncharacterized protein n=1 Tax=Populus alba TaxID=43335 RepID=A0ACC4B8H0_POPAL
MGLSVVCLLMLVLVCHGAGLNDMFQEEKCKKHGPAIRFPFRRDNQPVRCGYPGFVLSCNERKETLLQLPTSVTLNIKKIDYASRLIIAADPDNCFPRQLRNFSLSKSPFKFAGQYRDDYALFNCTSKHGDFDGQIPCLGAPGYDIYAYSSNYFLGYTDLTSCTKMYNVTSIPSEMIDRYNILQLNWSEPAACGVCEEQGKFCGWKNNITNHETECYKKPKSKKGKIRKIEGAGEISANLEVLELFPYLASSELS